jgi:hypothetical protein
MIQTSGISVKPVVFSFKNDHKNKWRYVLNGTTDQHKPLTNQAHTQKQSSLNIAGYDSGADECSSLLGCSAMSIG